MPPKLPKQDISSRARYASVHFWYKSKQTKQTAIHTRHSETFVAYILTSPECLQTLFRQMARQELNLFNFSKEVSQLTE